MQNSSSSSSYYSRFKESRDREAGTPRKFRGDGTENNWLRPIDVAIIILLIICLCVGGVALGFALTSYTQNTGLEAVTPIEAEEIEAISDPAPPQQGIVNYNTETNEYTTVVGETSGDYLRWSTSLNKWVVKNITREHIGHITFGKIDYTFTAMSPPFMNVSTEEYYIAMENEFWGIEYDPVSSTISLSGDRVDPSSKNYINPLATFKDIDVGDVISSVDDDPIYKLKVTMYVDFEIGAAPVVLAFTVVECAFPTPVSHTSRPFQMTYEISENDSALSAHSQIFLFGVLKEQVEAQGNQLCLSLRFNEIQVASRPLTVSLTSLTLEFEYLVV